MSKLTTPRPRTPFLGFAIVGCGAAIAPLDFAVNMAFPAMTEAFALATPDIRWVAVCYVITYGSLMLFCGVLGDRLGHLRVFRWGLVLSALALVACAAAPSYGWLLAGRVLQGIGVALTLSCAPALAITRDEALYVPLHHQMRPWSMKKNVSIAHNSNDAPKMYYATVSK